MARNVDATPSTARAAAPPLSADSARAATASRTPGVGHRSARGAIDEIDRHHTVGHAFFMADEMSSARLKHIWKRKLAPLIEEYFFDQPDIAETFVFDEYFG